MSSHKDLVQQYFDGFRKSDHDQVLSCLTGDVVWQIHGHGTLTGKAEFDSAIETEGMPGPPELVIDRLVEEGDTLVAIGDGSGALATGGRQEFKFCTVFTFTGELISRVDSYLVFL